MASAAAACTPRATTDRAAGAIEISAPIDVETFDPRFTGDWIAQRASRLVHAGLVQLDPDTLTPRPLAAKSWRWIDERTLRVELREDVRFHGGAPLTSRDVAASLAAYASPLVQSRHLRVVEAIERTEEDGPHAITIHLSRAHATLITDLEIPILRADQAMSPPDPDGALDGLGPYAVARATRGDVLLVPADGSVLPRPSCAIALRTVHDDNARALRLLAGRTDVAINVLGQVPALEGREGLTVVSRPGANLTYLIPRDDRPPFSDARVRRALSWAIDRAGLAATLFGGHARVATTMIPPGHWSHADLPPEPFDVAAARALLAQATGGARVRATLLTSTDRFRVTVGRAVAQTLADAGFDVEVIPLELGTMLARLKAGDFELAILGMPEVTEPNVLRQFLHHDFVPPAGYNRARVQDDGLDALLDAGDRVMDTAARRAIYARVEARVRDEEYLLPLWHEDQVVVTSARARGFVPSAEGRWLGLATLKCR